MSLPTIIIRHTRENLKKCSLRGLEDNCAFRFFTYPKCAARSIFLPGEVENYILLDVEGEPLSKNDQEKGLLLVDATWRLAEKIVRCTPWLEGIQKRSIPQGFRTAYPRRQDDCIDPEAGLASIEALYIAHLVAGKPCDFLLDHYYWKNEFLEKNRELL
jgi:pre-rRNA-processing protein TSR3